MEDSLLIVWIRTWWARCKTRFDFFLIIIIIMIIIFPHFYILALTLISHGLKFLLIQWKIFSEKILFFFFCNFQHLMQQKILINQTHFLVFNFQYLDECGFIGSQVSTAKSSYISLTWHYRNLQSFLSKLNWW